mmetsp:Transcript_28194/g.76424  ORF Transcript_28194/g.76424 Transcript_28194/m.76424 type:complete len:386 (-) Transcript_28194:205-1362(-)
MTIAIRKDDDSSPTGVDALRNGNQRPLSKHHNGCENNDKENTQIPNVNPDIVNDDDSAIDKNGIPKIVGGTVSSIESAETTSSNSILARSRESLSKEISKQVLRHKLQKLRHLVLEGVISKDYLDHEIFYPYLLEMFDPQTVTYNGGIAKVKEWKISCYLEVMQGGVPCTNPHVGLLNVFRPLLETCDDLFMIWYKQQHACNSRTSRFRKKGESQNNSKTQYTERKQTCKRLMTFVTRYTPAPGEQALLKHIDGAGKVDGSCVVALPVDRWSAAEEINSFYGHGGGLTFWDGREPVPEEEETPQETSTAHGSDTVNDKQQPQVRRRPRFRPREIHYDTRQGDIAFIDRAVWHQADPITKGTRWALVIFYKVTDEEEDGADEQHQR